MRRMSVGRGHKMQAALMKGETGMDGRNQELIKMLKEVKGALVYKKLRGDDFEEMQEAVRKLEEIVTYINDCTGKGIYFE